MEAETGMTGPQFKNGCSHQTLGKARKRFSPGTSAGSMALDSAGDTDVRFLAFRTVRGYIFVVLNYQFHSNLLQQPQETNTGQGTHSEMEWDLKSELEPRNAGGKDSLRGQKRPANRRAWCPRGARKTPSP